MELAGIVGMGTPQEGIRPDVLKYIFVKGPELSEQPSGRPTFWVFNQSHTITVPATVSAESQGQQATADRQEAHAEPSATKQRSITDFFSPRSTHQGSDSSSQAVTTSSFIKPCPSVQFADVPVVFQEQSSSVAEDFLDPTHPLFDGEALETSPKMSSPGSYFSPAAKVGLDTPLTGTATKREIDFKKLCRRYSVPGVFATWNDRMVSNPSDEEALLEIPANSSWWSYVDSPESNKEEKPFDSFSSPADFAAAEMLSASPPDDPETDVAEVDIEKFWIEKDEDRLTVIANMEKMIAEMKGELANTVTAFQMACTANHKLQAELEKKKTTLSQIRGDMQDLVHDVDVADINNEKLKEELDHIQKDWKHQHDRAEEALQLARTEPSKEALAKLLQANAEAESRILAQKAEMESEKEFLESQLEERCGTVARLTETLSRVADSDKWQDVKNALEHMTMRAKNIPSELEAALLECEHWKNENGAMQQENEMLLAEKYSLEETLHQVEEFDLRAIQELKQDCKNKEASERALKECLKNVFERMVRCSLCLETEGYEPFDRKHRAISERVAELTGNDYQQPLVDLYDDGEHDIQAEFNFGGDIENMDGDEDVYFDDSVAGNLQHHLSPNNQEHTEDSSSPLQQGPTEEDSADGATTKEQEALETRIDREITHTYDSQEVFPTATDQATPAVTDPSFVTQGPFHAPSDNMPSPDVSSSVSPKPQSSNAPTFPTPIFQSNEFKTAAGSNGPTIGNSIDFGFSKSPPPSLFAKISASSETNSSKGSESLKQVRASKSAEPKPPSILQEGIGEGIWSNTLFATSNIGPFSPRAPSAANSEAQSNGNSPILESPQLSQAKTPASEPTKVQQGTQTTESPDDGTPSVPNASYVPTQLPNFSFGGTSNPFAFTASSPPSFSTPTPQPASAGIFQFGARTDPSSQPEEKVAQDGTAADANGISKNDISTKEKKKATKKEEHTRDSNLHSSGNSDRAATSTTPSPPPSRRSQRAAKKALEKASKKVEMEAKNARVRERRRVQDVLMMRCGI